MTAEGAGDHTSDCSTSLVQIQAGVQPDQPDVVMLTSDHPVQEAAEAIKPILGKYYNYDSRNVFAAMWQDWHVCCYVAPDVKGGDVLWFRQ